ncbi:MAG TPA: YihY/virulence factor BrkB family protein [Dehalococcoidia bacterium]|jgi:membrane protein
MLRRLWILTKSTVHQFNRDNCSQHAAAISYYALFSLAPFAILVVSILGFFLTNDATRQDVINTIVDALPLSSTEGHDAVQNAVDSVRDARTPIAALSLVLTIWTASAMFGSLRRALNLIWHVEEHRPFFRAKLIDLAQVGILASFLLGSIAATGFLRAIRQASVDHVGPLADNNWLWEVPPLVLPALLTLFTFSLLYRYVPAAHPHWRVAIPGALLATIMFEALKNAFAFYVANFNNYNVIYGSLAGVLLFLLNTYLASNIVLLGGEVSRTFDRYYAGELDAEINPPVPGPSIAEQARRAVKGLFVRE